MGTVRRAGKLWTPIVVLASIVVSTGAVPSGATPIATGDFCSSVPSDLASYEPGALIRWEVETDLWPTLTDLTAYRVMFRSDGYAGDAVAQTGMVLVPTGEPPAGGWPVVAWGHGTSGLGDACAPSKYPSLYSSPWGVNANEIARLVHDGYVVAAPDYEGLGTPGRHPYLLADSQGISMIDATRAAREIARDVAGTTVDVRWAAVGHSQGGEAAIASAELAGSRAPELTFVGAVALAPATSSSRW